MWGYLNEIRPKLGLQTWLILLKFSLKFVNIFPVVFETSSSILKIFPENFSYVQIL